MYECKCHYRKHSQCIFELQMYDFMHLCVYHTFGFKMVTFSEEKHWGISTEGGL